MKKFLLLLLFLMIYAPLSAQLDREHWFAPMMDRTNNGNQYQTLYMSTDEIVPFKVDVYSNNVIIGSVNISKNKPGKFTVPRNAIITNSSGDLFKPVGKGLYLKGEKPYYASLRFSVVNHGEIVTSKGTAGIGLSFRAVMAPITASNNILNFMTSIMATEDNTRVTINEFDPTVAFSDGVTRTQFAFSLNKGESYILDGTGGDSKNWTGFIGARIDSDKPVSVTNGNFNGQYAISTVNSSDILMDQSVPTDKLGQEFVLMKGNGSLAVGMERALIVATENNTQIYLNGSGSPAATLNAGEHFITPTNAYLPQGASHYNMHIKTTKNAYVYQLLAGANSSTGATEEATGGFNYIPPLSCYLPKKIDEIGLIQENFVVSNGNPGGILDIPTKLNIITASGATVDVKQNGVSIVLTPANGPFKVTGSSSWVTYSIPNITGNVAVFSSSAVTAGISAGDDAVGYGGYFAGFSYTPAIIKQEGECLPGVRLAITEGFTSYQWLIKDASGSYIPAPTTPAHPSNTEFQYFPTQAGIYAVEIKEGICPQIRTADFKFYNCTTYTNTDYETCSVYTVDPAFSLSTQSVDPATVKITVAPKSGKTTIDPSGKITYTAYPGTSGTEIFQYSFCGTGAIPDCETAQATIVVNQIVGKDAILKECSGTGSARYDLRKADVTADTTVAKVYYKTRNGAENQISGDVISNFTDYPSADAKVYVRITNAKNCVAVQEIELKSKPFPVINEMLYTKLHCDDEDGIIDNNFTVDPAEISPVVLVNSASFLIKYYDTKAKAEAGAGDNIIGNYKFTQSTATIWMRVESAENCVTVKAIPLKTGAKIKLTTKNLNDTVCDLDINNSEPVNLADYIPKLTSETGATALYFATRSDAENSTNAIPAAQIVSDGTVANFYYQVKSSNFCTDIAEVHLTLIKGFASTALDAQKTICETSVTFIDAGNKHVAWEWFDENDPSKVFPKTQTQSLGKGKYFVLLTSPNGCVYKQKFEIVGSPAAKLDTSKFNAVICDGDLDGTVKVKFSTQVSPVILLNPHPDLTLEYYRDAAMSATQQLTDDFSYQTDTRIYVKAVSKYCAAVTGFIDFKIGNKVALLSSAETLEECDDDLDGTLLVKDLLTRYKSNFTADNSATVKFYTKEADAQKEAANNIAEINVVKQQILYVRISNATDCPTLAQLTIKIKVPRKSDKLELAEKIICPDTTTGLEIENDFKKYEWFKEGETTSIGSDYIINNLGIGKYFIILTAANDCTYKQNFEIKAAQLPEIQGIEISGSTVKINVKGGKEPYRYAVDGSPYQVSNIFMNLAPGLHKAYVISADNCDPVEKEFSVIEIYNMISPNGDGVNDVLDMSLLKYKIDVKFQIFDRQGTKLFDGTPINNFTWDGKKNGKVLVTSSYWYVMEWKDFADSPPVKNTGWILLKNRNTD